MSSWMLPATLLLFACMVVGSLYARAQLPAGANLPMQWGFNGRPTWYAPRDMAVAFVPVIALFVLLVMYFANYVSRGRLSWAMTLTAAIFLVVHGVWLYFALHHTGRS